jgi:integrase/recombinase XerC
MSSTALVPVSSTDLLAGAASDRLVAAFLAGRNVRTLAAYRADLEAFRLFAGEKTTEAVAQRLLNSAHGDANGLALAFKSRMVEQGLAPATINRRLAALRSLVKLANTLGMVPWALIVENVRSQSYRDTRGPGRDGFRRLWARGQARPDAKGLRDSAIIRLLHDIGLRRGEVVSLDVEHVDLDGTRVFILGKGRTEREPITLPAPTKTALVAWLEVRGTAPGPLFLNYDRAGKGDGRLTGAAVYHVVRTLGDAVGMNVRPHGLRHLAITEALDLTQGDVRAVQKFSRHRDVRVINRYDDNRQDLAGDVARMVASTA